jgi:WD40 repeat protein
MILWEPVMVSGSYDGKLFLWNEKGEKVDEITAPGEVCSLVVWQDCLWSAIWGGSIIGWSRKKDIIKTLTGSYFVTAMIVWDELLVVSKDKTVLIWTPEFNQKTITGHTATVTGLEVWESNLFSCSLDGTVRGWQKETHNCICLIEGTEFRVMKACEEFLVTGCIEGKIIVWDRYKGFIDEKKIDDKPVRTLGVWKNHMFTSADMKLFGFNKERKYTSCGVSNMYLRVVTFWNGNIWTGHSEGDLLMWKDPYDWSPSNHYLFCEYLKKKIETIVLLSLRDVATDKPRHPSAWFWILPMEILTHIFQWLAVIEL